MTMVELLSKFTPGELIALVAIVGGLICGTVTIVAIYWYSIRKSETEAKLKTEMLDRGMSAEEIQIVLGTGSKCDPD